MSNQIWKLKTKQFSVTEGPKTLESKVGVCSGIPWPESGAEGHTQDSPGVAAGNCLNQFAVKLFSVYQPQLEAWLSGLLLKPGVGCTKCCMLSPFSGFQVFVSPWTIVCQAPLSIEFSRQQHWSGLSFSSLGDLPDPGI